MKNNPFVVSLHDLLRRPGEMKIANFSIDEHEAIGTEIVSVLPTTSIDIDLRLESVSEGVLATGEVHTEADAQCGRCLENVIFDIDESFVQLFYYLPSAPNKGKKKGGKGDKKEDLTLAELEEEEALFIENDMIDLDLPVRDAVVLNLPLNPLCSEDCLGLCPDCGLKLIDLPEDHSHPKTDIRWAGLEGLDFSK